MSLPDRNIWNFDGDVKIGLYPDAHCMPGHDSRPVEAIARWFASEGVDVVVNIGDFNDIHSLSSYDKGTVAAEGQRLKADLDYSREMLELFEFGMEGHDANLIITEGNHEARLYRLYKEEPSLADLLGDDPFGYKEYGYEVYPYLDITKVNGVAFSHAFINPTSLNGSIQTGSADIRMKNVGFPHVAGHQHGPLIHGQRMLGDGTPLSTLILGCAHTESHAYWGRGKEVYRGAAILNNVRGGAYDLDVRYLGNLLREFT